MDASERRWHEDEPQLKRPRFEEVVEEDGGAAMQLGQDGPAHTMDDPAMFDFGDEHDVSARGGEQLDGEGGGAAEEVQEVSLEDLIGEHGDAPLSPVDRIIVIQRMRGVTAHEMLEQIVEQTGMQELLVRYSGYPEAVLWRLVRQLLESLMEPPVRQKLPQHNTLDDAVRLIRNATRIIVLTGAGISVSCGIPDFRSENGIYARLGEYHLPNPQCMFDLEFFNENPKPFFHFAKELLPGNFVPAPTHFFIGELHARGKLRRNFTQNIDGLERLAGVTGEVPWGGDVLHQCHGHFDTITCTNPECRHKGLLADIRPQIEAQQVPMCPVCAKESATDAAPGTAEESLAQPPTETGEGSTGTTEPSATTGGQGPSVGWCRRGVLKPDIVFFGENLGDHFRHLINGDKQQGNCDLVLVMGSSLAVGPVNMIPNWVEEDVPQILINREPVGRRIAEWDIELLGDCDAIVAELSRRLGWELPAAGTSEKAPVVEEQPSEFVPPNRYLFRNAKVQPDPTSSDDEAGKSSPNEEGQEGTEREDEGETVTPEPGAPSVPGSSAEGAVQAGDGSSVDSAVPVV